VVMVFIFVKECVFAVSVHCSGMLWNALKTLQQSPLYKHDETNVQLNSNRKMKIIKFFVPHLHTRLLIHLYRPMHFSDKKISTTTYHMIKLLIINQIK